MAIDTHAFEASWRAALENDDFDGLLAHLADDMTFYSPAIFKPVDQRAYIDMLLLFVKDTFDDFHYVDAYHKEDGLALVFAGKVGDFSVEGVDFFKLNDDNKASELRVMIRPLNSLLEFAQRMKARFADVADIAGGQAGVS